MPVGAGMDIFGGDSPKPWKDENVVNSWLTLAQVLGVSDSVKDYILAGANVTEYHRGVAGVLQSAPQGVIYIDNFGKGDLKITSVTPEYQDGWGLMYVTGDVYFQNLVFRGLIYVEGDARITGNFWILGSIVIRGTTAGDFSAGNGTFLYSLEALDKYTNRGMDFHVLSWREVV